MLKRASAVCESLSVSVCVSRSRRCLRRKLHLQLQMWVQAPAAVAVVAPLHLLDPPWDRPRSHHNQLHGFIKLKSHCATLLY
jgi:hypothetical protein